MFLHIILLTTFLSSNYRAHRPVAARAPVTVIRNKLFTSGTNQTKALNVMVTNAMQLEQKKLSQAIRSQYKLPRALPMCRIQSETSCLPTASGLKPSNNIRVDNYR